MPSFLHTSKGARSKCARIIPKRTLFILSGTLVLFGCSSQPSNDQIQPQSKLTQSKQAPTHQYEGHPSYLPNDHLAELLAAEFTLQREGASQAFTPFYKLVSETKNKKLAERLLRISAATQDKSNISKSSNLVMSIAPKDQQAYVLKFQVLMQSNSPKETAQLLEKAIQNQVALDFLPVYADDSIRSVDTMNALEAVIDQLSFTAKQNPFVQASLARVLFSQGKYAQSMALSKKLISNNSTRTSPLYLILAYSQNQQGNTNNAIKTLQAGMKHYPSSPRLLSPLLEFLVQEGELATANKAYRTATLQNSERVQAGIHYSNALIASHHPKEALTILDALPSNRFGLQDQVYYLRATALFDNNQKDEAIKTMKKVNGVLSNNATNQIVVWLYEEGKEDQINNIVLNRTHQQYLPDIANAVSHLHEEKGHNKLSLELLTQALEKNPKADALRYHKAILDDAMGNWQDAVKEMQILLVDHPNNATYLNALGYTLLSRTPQTDKAMTYIEKAYQIEQDDPAISDSLGWGYFLQGKLQQATRYLTKAWKLFPDSDIAAHLGESLWAQNKNDQANAIWRKALDGKQSSPLLINTIKRLNPSLINTQEKETTS